MPNDTEQFDALRDRLNNVAHKQRVAAQRKALRPTGEVILQAAQDHEH